jgi:hypothetical protein
MTTIPVVSYALITHFGMLDDDAMYPWNLDTTITLSNIGAAMSVHTGVSATAKLCGVNDIILGRLEQVETRVIEGVNLGVIAMQGGVQLTIDTTTVGAVAPTYGDSVQGSTTPGTVMKLAAAQGRSNVVTDVSADGTTCIVLFF